MLSLWLRAGKLLEREFSRQKHARIIVSECLDQSRFHSIVVTVGGWPCCVPERCFRILRTQSVLATRNSPLRTDGDILRN
jgi:hypothetical protein